MTISLSAIIESLDQQILSDPATASHRFAHLLTAERELGLLHGERPTCPFLRPHILSRTQYDEVSHAAQTIARAFEKLVAYALADDDLLRELGMTEKEEKLARVDPGYSRLCVTSRLDGYLNESGFQFFEYNAESPAGIADQMQLEALLFELPHVKQLMRQYPHWRPQPHKRLLDSLVAAYREWGGEEEFPQIGIVDWEGVSTATEFEILRKYFTSLGHHTIIADPRALEYDGMYLTAAGTRIDILYKRVIIHEFLARFDESHPLARAFADHRVCMANSFRTKVAHKKSGFAILSDPRYATLFTDGENRIIKRCIPWTRWLREGPTSFHDSERDLREILQTERDRLVLKPNDDYGGQGVIFGWETECGEWANAVQHALKFRYVVQERVPVRKVSIPTFTDHLAAQEMIVDFDPFLFRNEVEGGLVRLSASSLSNVSSGGGETAMLVLENY